MISKSNFLIILKMIMFNFVIFHVKLQGIIATSIIVKNNKFFDLLYCILGVLSLSTLVTQKITINLRPSPICASDSPLTEPYG